MLATAGGRQDALRFNIEGALNEGVKRAEVIEALIQLSIYAGFPAALNAFTLANGLFNELDDRKAVASALSADPGGSSEGRKERVNRGLAVLRRPRRRRAPL